MSERLVCIRDKSDGQCYRTTRSVARSIIESDTTSSDWHYTTKGAWKRGDRKRIPQS